MINRAGLAASPALAADVLTPASRWPHAAEPVALLAEIAEWLGGYGNQQTRRTYAEGLGLPVSADQLQEWAQPLDGPDEWAAAVHRYARTVLPPSAFSPVAPERQPGPPPAPRGRLRHLHWFRWCATHGVDPARAGTEHVKAWLAELTAADAAPATRDRMLATVKTLYAHLAGAGVATGNPAALSRRRLGLTATAASTSSTITLTGTQVAALHAAAAAPRRGASELDTARAAAIVALFTLGLRVSELCGLDETDLHITRGRRALRVHGKGGKVRIVYLSAPADAALTHYLSVRAASEGRGDALARRGHVGAASERPLLVTRGGNRFQRQAIWQLLRRIAASAGEELAPVADAMHPHALRHFYVTAAVEAGAQLADVQSDVGHSSIDTTRKVYDHAAPDPARSAIDLVAAAWQPSDRG
ncbi:tyrosine-type recombinase/integrase [Amycolatopsis albispora]|uniref:Integrase n=1 Tax=Amycolatopsis albispora TaxID=1804986 RepID=A0A344L3G9_9PSEU|nr:tyrosine-type recombinase/integrase [Amycolatopsis albispora]AXB42593.1 integrase [Amycolatopsis albispora]